MKRLNLVKNIYLNVKNNAFSLEKKSNKFFGILLTLIFLIIAFYPKTINTNIKFYFIFFAFVNLIISLIKPNVFAIFNYLFIQLGIILGKIFSPIILSCIFVLLILPIGLIKKLFNTSKDANKKSYWISRREPVQSMDKQY